MSTVSISVIDNYHDWAQLAPQWDQLLSSSSAGTFFQTWQWLFSWAECSLNDNRSLFILACYAKEQLIGIAPFYVQKKTGALHLRELRFLGGPDIGSDYLSVICQRSAEKKVAYALYDFLFSGSGRNYWDKLLLQEIPAQDKFLLHFLDRAEQRGKYAEVAMKGFCPRLVLPGSKAELYAACSPGWRKKVKQDIRVINREQQVQHVQSQGRDIEQYLTEFLNLYEQKSGWSGSKQHAVLQKTLARHDSMPPVQIDLLYINGHGVAGLLHLVHKSSLYMYLMAVDRQFHPKVSLGNYLLGQAIAKAIDAGYSDYDLLKGQEDYKFHWAPGGTRTLQVSMWRKSPASLCSAFSRLSRHAGKLLLR